MNFSAIPPDSVSVTPVIPYPHDAPKPEQSPCIQNPPEVVEKLKKGKPNFEFLFPNDSANYSFYITGRLFEVFDAKESAIAHYELRDDIAYLASAHLFNDKLYIVGKLLRYTSNSVFLFDRKKGSLQCMISPLRDPQFVENLLIEFGTGCNEEGQGYGLGCLVTIYDLSLDLKQTGTRIVRKIREESGRWDGWMDSEKKTVILADQASREHVYPFSDLIKSSP